MASLLKRKRSRICEWLPKSLFGIRIRFFKTYIDCLVVHRIVLIRKPLELLSIAYLNLNVNTGLSAYSDNTIQCALFDTQCKL